MKKCPKCGSKMEEKIEKYFTGTQGGSSSNFGLSGVAASGTSFGTYKKKKYYECKNVKCGYTTE